MIEHFDGNWLSAQLSWFFRQVDLCHCQGRVMAEALLEIHGRFLALVKKPDPAEIYPIFGPGMFAIKHYLQGSPLAGVAGLIVLKDKAMQSEGTP